jgi:lysophospholipase L1-like esterase
MKKILIVGDSLTTGHAGVNYVNIIARANPSDQVLYHGQGGDTLAGISRRLLLLIKRDTPDLVVIEAGTNDLLLPWFRTREAAWKNLAYRLKASGSVPAMDLPSFRAHYTETIEEINRFGPRIIIMTISCLGEDLKSAINQQRKKYNNEIRRIAAMYGLLLADVGKAFDNILQAVPTPSDYLLNDFYSMFLDTLITTLNPGANPLSRQRGLVLTVDGVHLNQRGARIFAETIMEKMK